jgi:glycerol-3-phosphate responsive antiterminator
LSEHGARLPRLFVATSGRDELSLPDHLEAGLLLRDLDLSTLVVAADAARRVLALDLDAVEGLNPDSAAASFVTRQLGIEIVATRRPSVAADIADLGAQALLHILAFDSTGLGRALEGDPHRPGVGSLISPGPVVAYLTAGDLARLPRPLVAYGLIDTPARAASLLTNVESVVVSAECAIAMQRTPW